MIASKSLQPALNSAVRQPMKYPSLFQRYLASTIDVFLILFLLYLYARSPLSRTASGATAVWPMWLFVIYEPLCNRCGTTLGQFVMGFRVRTMKEHMKVSLWRGFVRVFAKYLLGAISFIKMPIHKQRRALHDIIAGTIAVNAGAQQESAPPAT